ncbi:MAG: DUF362 domain-containing protein [Bacteroidales bacterium]|jgi:uncharacterized protein (DUF362 family)|nr:DUF362 domain-containing protein [Bacteroidales bacterium]
MDRRSFLKRGAASGAAAFIGTSLLGKEVMANISAKTPDIAVATGTDYFENTRKVVESLGGMRKFVPKHARVGLLINSAFETKGTYVEPDISLSVLKMCFEAKAREVILLQKVYDEYWTRSTHLEDLKGLFDSVKQVESNEFPAEFNEADWKVIPKIEGSVSLQEVEVIRALDEIDVLINIFIAKHHAGSIYTGAMKNSMGFCTRKTNVFYHLGSGERNDPDFLAQCIADINLLRQPDLIIGDATEFILTNGPSGPGDTRKMDTVFAGTNLVGMDALGVKFNDVFAEDVPTLAKAEEVGLGSADLKNYNIVEVG